MGGTISKEESLSNLKKEDLSLPDIAIEFPSPITGNEGSSFSSYDTQMNKKEFTMYGFKDLSGLLAYGVPFMKGLIDLTLDKLKTLASNKQEDVSLNKRLFAEEKVTELKDLMDLYYDCLRRYCNDLPKMMEETKIFQRNFFEQLKRVKNSMIAGHISSPSFKIWVNGAAFHVEMLLRIAQLQSAEDSHSIRQAILIYQEDLQQLIECYRKFRVDSIDMKGGSLNDQEQRKHIDNVSLDKHEVTKYLFDVDKQIPTIQQHFRQLLDRVDDLVMPDPTNSTAGANEVADERMTTSGSDPGNLRTHREGVTVVELQDDGPARDPQRGQPNVDNLTRSPNSSVNGPTTGIWSNPQHLVEVLKIHSLLMKFTVIQVRRDFLHGMFNIPVHESKLLQEIDQLNSRLLPFTGNHSDTGSQTAFAMLSALVEEKPEPLDLGTSMTVRTYKSWAQILTIIAKSDYWDTFDYGFTDNQNPAQESGRSLGLQDRDPSATSSQNQEQSNSSYPEYQQNQHSVSKNVISNTRFYCNSKRGNHRSAAPRDFSQIAKNPESKGRGKKINYNRRSDLCMFCGKPGHKVEKCSLNVQCPMCSKRGHSLGSCPENRIVFKCPICEEDHLGKDCPRFCGELSF